MTIAKTREGLFPSFEGSAAIIAGAGLFGVPLLVAFFPRWAWRLTMPLLAVTSIGVYLTVPDTEHAINVMTLTVAAAVVAVVISATMPHMTLPGLVASPLAVFIMGAALADSAGRGYPIARAIGCFGVLITAPVASGLRRLRDGEAHRRPAMLTLAVVHCVVAGFCSRALIRQTSDSLVVAAVGAALLASVAVLYATARPVAAEPT